MEQRKLVEALLDYIFGVGVAKALEGREVSVEYSRKTGRMKHIYVDGRILATLRPDGGLALTLYGAETLLRSRAFRKNCVTVSEEAEESVRLGKSVFAKHVIEAGDRIRPACEVAVLNRDGELLAVGKAILSAKMMKSFGCGVAVKVRVSVGAKRAGNA